TTVSTRVAVGVAGYGGGDAGPSLLLAIITTAAAVRCRGVCDVMDMRSGGEVNSLFMVCSATAAAAQPPVTLEYGSRCC
ncbi:hypothetical protein TSMEX_007556, partial [Taenia solium]